MTRTAAARRAAVLGLLLVAADQLTKAVARGAVERGGEDPVLPGIKIVNSRNTGVAFSALSDGGALVFVLVGVALAGLLFFFWRYATRPGAWVATGLLLGGAVGNLVDRVREGAVTDFIKIPLWPSFNLADVAITAGVVALLIVIERSPDDGPRPA